MTKARAFGTGREKSPVEKLYQREERLWDLIEADFATLQRECEIEHPSKMSTLGRIREEFEELEGIYRSLIGIAEKSKNQAQTPPI